MTYEEAEWRLEQVRLSIETLGLHRNEAASADRPTDRSVFVAPKFAITVENNHIVPNRYNYMGRWYKDRVKW